MRVDVPLAEGAVAQGRQIVRALLQPPPAPYLAVIPAGTTLRALYLTAGGDAFVDLSAEVSTKHPGGTQAELLTVYAIVNAVTTNLQGVRRVQLLIDGREADTVAGHVDVRRPLRARRLARPSRTATCSTVAGEAAPGPTGAQALT